MIAVQCGDKPVGTCIRVASTFFARFAGLMFHRELPQGSGLLLMPCTGIHMCFMRMPLDIVYLDGLLRVLAVQRGLRPWRLGKAPAGTRQVLELPDGTINRCAIACGMTLNVRKPEAACRTILKKRGVHEDERKEAGCEF